MLTISRKYYYSTVTNKCILLGIIRYFNRYKFYDSNLYINNYLPFPIIPIKSYLHWIKLLFSIDTLNLIGYLKTNCKT